MRKSSAHKQLLKQEGRISLRPVLGILRILFTGMRVDEGRRRKKLVKYLKTDATLKVAVSMNNRNLISPQFQSMLCTALESET